MPTQSVLKRQRQNQKKRLHNRVIKSKIRTITRKYIENVNEKKDSQDLYKELSSLIDRAVQKGVYKKNTASRKKSRLYKLLRKE